MISLFYLLHHRRKIKKMSIEFILAKNNIKKEPYDYILYKIEAFFNSSKIK